MTVVQEEAPRTHELEPLIESARGHYCAGHAHGIALRLDLDALFLAHAHRAHDFANFSVWAEARIGVPASTVRGLTREGRVLRILAEHRRVNLDDPASCPSTASLRVLAKVKADRGPDDMVAVLDYARSVGGDRVREQGVRDAVRDLFHPRVPSPDHEYPDRERPYPGWDEPDDEEEPGDLLDALGILVEELDRLGVLTRRRDRRALQQVAEIEIELAQVRELVAQHVGEES